MTARDREAPPPQPRTPNADLDELSSYRYTLPDSLIAARPPKNREDARLMVVHRHSGRIDHRTIRDLPVLLRRGDCLVLNNTRVLPARLFGVRTATGGRWEGLFLSETTEGTWQLICETRGKLRPGETITIHPAHESSAALAPLELTLLGRDAGAVWSVRVHSPNSAFDLLSRYGTLPLPPYIGRRKADSIDRERYQTTFGSIPGAIAAPTAGLHLTPDLSEQLQLAGVTSAELTLHVGIGTFRPIKSPHLADHQMHSEWCRVSPETADLINSVRRNGGRSIAVGTTSVRTLESAVVNGSVQPFEGRTDIFLRPGHRFQAVDALLTNFHLPESTLLVLAAAFAGYDLIMHAYDVAVRNAYRFYSFGDAMLMIDDEPS